MACAEWSHGGRILYNASRVYYVPDEPSLPPLRWVAEQQHFDYLRSANSGDLELRASITELAQTCSELPHLPSVQQQPLEAASLSCYLPCEALYGVLHLGSANSVLLYVMAKTLVCTLTVGGVSHKVYAVRGLQWLHLPCVTSSATSQRQRRRKREGRGRRRGGSSREGVKGGDEENGAARRAGDSDDATQSPKAESGDEGNDSTNTTATDDDDDDDDVSGEVGRLPSKTVNDYLATLNSFCEAINTQDEIEEAATEGSATGLPGIPGATGRFSYLYYSPTLDLSANPVHLLGYLTDTPHPTLTATSNGKRDTGGDNSLSSTYHHDSGNGEGGVDATEVHKTAQHHHHHTWEDLRAAATTRQLYQWNGPLLSEGLALPTMAALQREFDVHCHRRNEEADKTTSTSTDLPWQGVYVEEVQRHARHVQTAPVAAPSPSSLPLYVPSFIRGLVAQTSASATTDMTLLTRVCCRWSGTRYNRRGLEPGHSGVVANMSMTTLWVTAKGGADNLGDGAPDAAASAFAVYTVMRGSVPRRWEQPANLALKPPIKISPVSSAAEEMSRHVRLLKQCHPELRALYCLDTMSQSKLEKPLSEAFAAAVRRHVEGTPKATSPANSVVVEAKDASSAAAAAAGHRTAEESNIGGGNGGCGERDPSVWLVKFDVKKELKTHHYQTMLQRCVAEMDVAAAAAMGENGGQWLDFTKGRAHLCGDERAVASNSSISFSTVSCTTSPDAAIGTVSPPSPPRLQLEHVQTQLVRVNCLDCLDRTNLVQSILLSAALPHMMAYVDGTVSAGTDDANTASAALTEASHRLRVLLAAQGTAISQLYAGTEPHFIPYMLNGHHHWSHKAVEAVLAQRRWYQQNFFDGVKQDGISLLTRQHNPEVFNADIESPFSRDLSGMNRQVMYGLVLGILPFLYSLMVCCSEHRFTSAAFQLHFAICLGWVVYLSVLYSKLMRYRVTYTNRPLLLYTRQAEWC